MKGERLNMIETMLKIRKDVNLKKLKKYGFDMRASSINIDPDWDNPFVDDNFGYIIKDDIYIYDRSDLYSNNYLKIYLKSTPYSMGTPIGINSFKKSLNTLFRLIKDDLLEIDHDNYSKQTTIFGYIRKLNDTQQELKIQKMKLQNIIDYAKNRCNSYLEDLGNDDDCEYCDGAFASCRKVLQLAGEDIKKYE